MRRLYGLLTLFLTPVFLAVFLWLSIREPGYRANLTQRLGRNLPEPRPSGNGRLWIHAVSVGETLAIAPLVEALLTRRPDLAIVVTSTTPSGAEQVERLFGDRVDRAWLPIDSRGAVLRCLDHWQPIAVVLVETELWPGLIHQCKGRGIKTLLLNGRLSARSLRGYARLGSLARTSVADLDHIACQHASDARRFRALGAWPARVSVVGSPKFDMPLEALQNQRDQLAISLGTPCSRRPIVLAASTHAGEDPTVIDAFKTLRGRFPNCALWLAPRHPTRSDALLELLRDAGLTATTRSSGGTLSDDTEVLLIDTLGELSAFMGLATVVFMGGSLVPHGGHNPLEALVFGRPVVTGPSTDNFASLYRDMEKSGLLTRVNDSGDLAAALENCLTADHSEFFAQQGPGFVDARRGALEAQFARLEQVVSS